MSRMLALVLAVVGGAGLVLASAGGSLATGARVKADPGASVARGKYLVASLGCGDCHTTKKMGPNGPEEVASMYLAGHPEGSTHSAPPRMSGPWMAATSNDMTAWAGPWGVSYAMNLTPDENTGIGSWSETTFVKAIRTGRHMGVSRPILPPMPWGAFRNLSDEDLKSIYAYLRTIRPIHNRIPDPEPPPSAPKVAEAR
jgi:mono/diheme cytochrome c family protein